MSRSWLCTYRYLGVTWGIAYSRVNRSVAVRRALATRERVVDTVSVSTVNALPLAGVMGPRDPEEPGRVATPLELLFDLVFVTAVASAGVELHDGVIDGDWGALVNYLLTFFAIWWAWVNYTWFASAYARDEVLFRVLTFVIMAGALVLAAGVPGLFEDGQSPVVVAGYAIMRLGMVALWLRAARHDPDRRTVARTYAAGILLVQVLWIGRLWVHGEVPLLATFLALVVAELAVPFVAERRQHTPFHPDHGAERSGAFTIIVLGEVVLASVVATQEAIAATDGGRGVSLDLLELVMGAFLVVVSMWWLYFRRDHADLVQSPKGVWAFGYLHYVVYAAIAAAGAGIAADVDVGAGGAEAAGRSVAWLISGAIVAYLLTLATLHRLGGDPFARTVLPRAVLALVVLALAAVCPTPGVGVLLMGVALACGVAADVVMDRRSQHVLVLA